MLTQFLAEFSVFNFITIHEKRFFQRNKLIGTLGLYLDFCDIYFRTFCTISNLLQPYLSPALLNQDSNCNFCKASNPPWQWRFIWSKTMNIQYLWCPWCLRLKHWLEKDELKKHTIQSYLDSPAIMVFLPVTLWHIILLLLWKVCFLDAQIKYSLKGLQDYVRQIYILW